MGQVCPKRAVTYLQADFIREAEISKNTIFFLWEIENCAKMPDQKLKVRGDYFDYGKHRNSSPGI
jgi:hypothetical protein